MPLQVLERLVEWQLTDKGRALQKQTEALPGCILHASGHSKEQLGSLKRDLMALRDRLQKAV